MVQEALLQDSITEGASSGLEKLSLDGQSCRVGWPEGRTPNKEACLMGDVEDRSPHCGEESSSEESMEREPCTKEDILKEAGVEIVLEELSCTENGKAPLELVTQVPKAPVVIGVSRAAALLPLGDGGDLHDMYVCVATSAPMAFFPC